MNKEQYFQNLEEIITDVIFIGNSKDDLTEEINNNMWRITMEQELAKEISITDFVEFFNKVIQNRQHQVTNSKIQQGMIFYLWFDWIDSQIRFNLISNLHEYLPFQCKLEILNEIEPIIKDFLEYPFLNGLPVEGYNNGSEEKPYVLKVYITVLNKD